MDQDQTSIPPKDDDGVKGPSSKEQVHPPLQAAALTDVYIPTFIDNNVEDDGSMASDIAEQVLKTIDLYEAHGDNIQIDEVVKFILDNSSPDELRAEMKRVIEQNAAREAEEANIFSGLPDLSKLDSH